MLHAIGNDHILCVKLSKLVFIYFLSNEQNKFMYLPSPFFSYRQSPSGRFIVKLGSKSLKTALKNKECHLENTKIVSCKNVKHQISNPNLKKSTVPCLNIVFNFPPFFANDSPHQTNLQLSLYTHSLPSWYNRIEEISINQSLREIKYVKFLFFADGHMALLAWFSDFAKNAFWIFRLRHQNGRFHPVILA